MTIVMPLKRPLYPPDSGHEMSIGVDVKAVKRPVARLGFWQMGEFDLEYNKNFAHGINKKVKAKSGVAGLQRWLGIQPTGWWGEDTHNAVLNLRIPKGLPHDYELAWDRFGLAQYRGYEDKSDAEKIVEAIFDEWKRQVAHAGGIHYNNKIRPVPAIRLKWLPPRSDFSIDCSGDFIYCALVGGARSPDAVYGFGGGGNTESMQNCGFRISELELLKYCKDHYVAAFYGPQSWNTVHMVAVENHQNVYSMGRESAPEHWNGIHYRGDFIELRAYQVI